MDFLVNGSQVTQLKKTEEFYIKTEDGREIVATKAQGLQTTIWAWRGEGLSKEEVDELKKFLTTLE